MRHDHVLEAGRWLATAEDDLESAGVLAAGQRHYAACFFAQQAAEKALKAVLFLHGARRVKGHSIADLCAACPVAEIAALSSELAPLDLYYIPTRYPNGLAGGWPSRVFQREDSARATTLAIRAVTAVRPVIEAAEE